VLGTPAETRELGRLYVSLLLGDHVVDRRQGGLLDRTLQPGLDLVAPAEKGCDHRGGVTCLWRGHTDDLPRRASDRTRAGTAPRQTSLPDALAIDAQRVEAEPVRLHGRVGPALAIDVIGPGPPQEDDSREFIALEKRGPATLGIVAVCHSPPVVLSLRSNECGAASGVRGSTGGSRYGCDTVSRCEFVTNARLPSYASPREFSA
jgi:hypothetical protein